MSVPLRTLLGNHPATRAVREGIVASPLVTLEFADVAVPNRAFKRVVRELEFDVAELALMTFLIARSRGIPLRLMPVVVFSRNPLPHLVCDASRRRMTPVDLPGCRVGVRSYSTTTAAWIRAIVADQFGVDAGPVDWVALDEGHVAGAVDPPNVRRDTSGRDLLALLGDGTVDAVIADAVPADSRFAPVVADPQGAWHAWQQRHAARTLNHLIVVNDDVARNERIVTELFNLFRESRELAGESFDVASAPIGWDANWRNLEVAIAVAGAQGLLARPLTIDDLVTPELAALR